MHFIRISETQVINLDHITRLELYSTQDIRYVTLHFDSGESYRCTEEESETLQKKMELLIDRGG